MAQPKKVAIVHDWFVGGGAEKVVLELHHLYPDAPIYTSYCSPEWRDRLNGKVVTGWLQHFGKLRKFLPIFRIWWFGRLRFDGYDLVISSSGAEAKGIKVPKNTLHVNYCHAPTHYYWSRYEQYLQHPGFGFFDPLARLGLKILVSPLRAWDRKAAQRPNVMIANSTHIQKEIKKYYGRDSVVINPPIDVGRFSKASGLKRRGFLTAGRQTPYKRFDLAIAACTKLNLPLTVIGKGPDHARLQSLAGPSITFLDNVSDADMPAHFAGAEAFIFPGLDDFGVTPVEAMAAGTPVIAYKGGGALDYVVENTTGMFFEEQGSESLEKTLSQFSAAKFDPKEIKAKAAEFSPAVFHTKFKVLLSSLETRP